MNYKNRRRGGSVVQIILGAFVLFLVFSALYYTALSLIQRFAGNVTGTTNTTTTTASYDNMSLAQLKSLSFSNSSECSAFLSQKWWDTALQASGKTVVTIIPNTAYALSQSYSGWANYLRENSTYTGLDRYAFDFVTRLAAQVMGTHDMTKAAALVQNYTSWAAAVPVTAADFVSFGGLSAIRVGIDTGNITLAVAQTFPAQIYQLFTLSQDCGYSEQQRATFFGTAMSMSLFVLATAGHDGFGPEVRESAHEAWAAGRLGEHEGIREGDHGHVSQGCVSDDNGAVVAGEEVPEFQRRRPCVFRLQQDCEHGSGAEGQGFLC